MGVDVLGHAVSPDLVRWTELPVAMRFTADEAFYSGTVVGTADGLVAAYTSVDPAGRQTQRFATSPDGTVWTPLPGRLTDPDPDFRDPKLIRTGDGWLLLVALPVQRKVRFYRSADLVDWRAVGEFGPAGDTTGLWEMPDLVRLPVGGTTRDVLLVGVLSGGPGGGCGTQYFLGDLDGGSFTATDTGWVDLGPDYYAAATFSGTPGRTVGLAWLNDWRYAEAVPTAPWRGILSAPRELGLREVGGRVRPVQRPVPELAWTEALRADRPAGELPVRGDRLRLDAVLTGPGGLVVRTAAGGGEGTRVGWSDGTLVLDRTASGRVDLHPDFTAAYPAALPADGGRVRLTVLVDRCSVEVFGGVGEVALSAQVFPAATSDRVVAYGSVEQVTISRPATTFPAAPASEQTGSHRLRPDRDDDVRRTT